MSHLPEFKININLCLRNGIRLTNNRINMITILFKFRGNLHQIRNNYDNTLSFNNLILLFCFREDKTDVVQWGTEKQHERHGNRCQR